MKATQHNAAGSAIAALGLLVAIVGCKAGSSELAFKGRCTDAQGHPVRSFTLAVAPASATTAHPVPVSASASGEYQARVTVPVAAAGRLLGAQSEKVTIKVAAPGYKPKTFNVTADQLMTGGEVNTLNVSLEPKS